MSSSVCRSMTLIMVLPVGLSTEKLSVVLKRLATWFILLVMPSRSSSDRDRGVASGRLSLLLLGRFGTGFLNLGRLLRLFGANPGASRSPGPPQRCE